MYTTYRGFIVTSLLLRYKQWTLIFGHVDIQQEHRIVIKFLVAEGVTSAEVYRRLCLVFKNDTISRSRVFEWSAGFRSGRQSVGEPRRCSCWGAAYGNNGSEHQPALVHFRTLITLWRVRVRVRVGLELRLGLGLGWLRCENGPPLRAVMLFNASNARNARNAHKLNQRSRRRYPDGGSVT